MSPKQRRIIGMALRYPEWSLTDGKPSRWLHIGAAFRHLEEEFTRIRARWPFMTAADRQWHRSVALPGAIRCSRFHLSLYPNRLP